MPPVLLLADSDIATVLDPDTCIEAVEEAFRAGGAGVSQPSAVMAVALAEGVVHVKAAALAPEHGVFVAKVNANFPGNPSRHGAPTIQGLVVVLDASSGAPLAVLESGALTRLRTAAATAVAARHLARRDAAVATIIGCGVQAEAQLEFLHRARPLARAMAFDTRADASRSFAARLTERLGIGVNPVGDFHEACRMSDIIITCTTAREPFLEAEDIPAGAFVAAVGADNPDKRELGPGIFRGAVTFVTDVTPQCAEIGELHHALADGVLTLDGVHAELGEIVAGAKPGRRREDERIVFDSTGTGIQDAAAAGAVCERARTLGLGSWFSFRS